LEKLKIAEWSRRDDLWKVGTKLNFSSWKILNTSTLGGSQCTMWPIPRMWTWGIQSQQDSDYQVEFEIKNILTGKIQDNNWDIDADRTNSMN
jgi:hypothetical protein